MRCFPSGRRRLEIPCLGTSDGSELDDGRVLSVHARAAVVSCSDELHLTSAHTYRTYAITSHLASHQLTSLHSTSLTFTSQSLPVPPAATATCRPLARLIASDLASRRCGARETPSFTWESLSGQQRPYLGYHHTHTLNSPLPTLEWPAPPSPLEHEVVIRVPKVA
jgi:hypothetical protein